ncbi:hypothetical protein Ancab_027837 [Ancistrocladus abbreviatus]
MHHLKSMGECLTLCWHIGTMQGNVMPYTGSFLEANGQINKSQRIKGRCMQDQRKEARKTTRGKSSRILQAKKLALVVIQSPPVGFLNVDEEEEYVAQLPPNAIENEGKHELNSPPQMLLALVNHNWAENAALGLRMVKLGTAMLMKSFFG